MKYLYQADDAKARDFRQILSHNNTRFLALGYISCVAESVRHQVGLPT